MPSDSDDEERYTVHVVRHQQPPSTPSEAAAQPVETDGEIEKAIAGNGTAPTSPLARYYRLGTQERHAFDEHMRHLRTRVQKHERERNFKQHHPFRPHRETVIESAAAYSLMEDANPMMRIHTAAPTTAAEANVHAAHVDPTLVASPARPVFDRLAAQAAQLELRRRHREEQQRRAEAAALRGSFQPTINRADPEDNSLQHLRDVPVEDRLMRYGETVTRERQRRQAQKEQEEAAAAEAARQPLYGGGGESRQPAEPDLRRQQQRDFEARNANFLEAQARHRAKATARDEFTFQPQISATSAALDEARQASLLQSRRADLQDLLNRSADGITLSVRQQSIGSSTNTGGGGREAHRRSDSLYAHAVARQQQQQQQGSANSAVSMATCRSVHESANTASDADRHRPLTNPTSDKWIASGAHRHFFEQDFVHRQTLYGQVKAEEAALKAAAGAEAAQDPTMTNSSSNAKKIRPEELADRLYYQAKTLNAVKERRRAASLNARECPFRPSLSPGTAYVLRHTQQKRDADVVKRLTGPLKMLPNRTALDLDPERKQLYAPAPSRRRSMSSSNASAEEWPRKCDPTASCSALPSTATSPRVREDSEKKGDHAPLSSASPSVASTKRRPPVTRDQVEHFYQRQIDARQQREDFIQEYKEGEAVQELVHCTFRPRTNGSRRESSGARANVSPTREKKKANAAPSSVSRVTGVTGFLERQSQARRRRAEDEERRRTLGMPRGATTAAGTFSFGGTTILSPFHLETERRHRIPFSSGVPSDDPPHPPQQRRTRLIPAEEEEDDDVEHEHGQYAAALMPLWAQNLSSSERALFEEWRGKDRVAMKSRASLQPLPGYASERADDPIEIEEGVFFDDGDGKERDVVSGAQARYYAMPRPSQLSVKPSPYHSTNKTQQPEARHDPVSLFAQFSPNRFTGRSLASDAPFRAPGHPYHPLLRGENHRHGPATSALRDAGVIGLTASAKRRKQTRSVSFADDAVASSSRAGRKLSGKDIL